MAAADGAFGSFGPFGVGAKGPEKLFVEKGRGGFGGGGGGFRGWHRIRCLHSPHRPGGTRQYAGRAASFERMMP